MTTPKSWTPERIEELQRLAGMGFSTLKISRLMGITIGAVSAACFKYGIKTHGKMPNGARHQTASKSQSITLPGPDWTKTK